MLLRRAYVVLKDVLTISLLKGDLWASMELDLLFGEVLGGSTSEYLNQEPKDTTRFITSEIKHPHYVEFNVRT